MRWLLRTLGFRQWRCDGCGRVRLCMFGRAAVRIEDLRAPLAGEPDENGKVRMFHVSAVRLYCKACLAPRRVVA